METGRGGVRYVYYPSQDKESFERSFVNETVNKLIEKFGVKIVLVGGKDTVENNELIRQKCKHMNSVMNLGGKTSLKQLFALVKRFNLFISNDTGPMHIAAAQGVPTIGLFGPNLPARFAPFGKGNIALYEKTWCSPCINVHKGRFRQGEIHFPPLFLNVSEIALQKRLSSALFLPCQPSRLVL